MLKIRRLTDRSRPHCGISKEVKKYLIDMKVQCISKDDVLKVAASFDEPEDRQKVLRIVYDEFRREYSSSIQ